MARTTLVKKARKDQGNCRGCGVPIKKGDPYKWAHPRYRAKVVCCEKCPITITMTSSSKMVAIWSDQEAVHKAETVEDFEARKKEAEQQAEEDALAEAQDHVSVVDDCPC